MSSKAAAYARFSSDNQREESITAQLRAIHGYAVKNDIEIIREYTDEARTATTDDRPGFLQMIDDIKTGRVIVDLVLVHKLDRFARNRYDSAVYRKILTQAGARLIAVDQPLDDRPESVLLESLLEGLAEYYSKNLSREVMKGMKENAYKGKFNGGWVPLGYDIEDGKYLINEREASIIRLIFSMFLEGNGYGFIMDRLNSMGFKTKRGKPFGKNSLHEILRNPKYAGYYVFNRAPRRLDGKRNSRRKKDNDEIITVPEAVPAIISEDDFGRVQEIMNGKKRGPRQQKDALYILTGKVICGECNSAMVGNSSRRAAGSEPTRYYECSRKLRTKECSSRRYPKEELEQYVFSVIQENFLSAEKIPEVAKQLLALAREKDQQGREEEITIQAKLDEVNNKISNIVKAVEDGADFQVFGSRLRELKTAREELQNRLGSLSSPLAGVTEEMVVEFLSAIPKIDFPRLNDMEKKKIVDSYVHDIKVFKDSTDVNLMINIGADKTGVGGGT